MTHAMTRGLLLWIVVASRYVIAQEEQTCSWQDGECYDDPAMKKMTFDIGHGNQTFWAYVCPDVSTFYQEEPGSKTPLRPNFIGQFAKFINMSPKVIKVFWDAGQGHDEMYIAEAAGFNAAGTACSPGHHFFVREKGNEEVLLDEFTVSKETSLYVYDPFKDDPESLETLSPKELELYNLQNDNLKFGKKYQEFTGREWLSLWPRRHPPRHHMWPADYFGQERVIETKETHFVDFPPNTELVGKDSSNVGAKPPDLSWYDWARSLFNRSPTTPAPTEKPKQKLQQYRSGETMNMTMTVLSCAPRIFEVKNFLSKTEVDHIMQLATGMTLHTSTTKAGADGEAREDKTTRTSRNTWVQRDKSPIVDIVYRRAADLLGVDEALMRARHPDERPDFPTRNSLAEQLQLVHYEAGQQYTPHHDFAIPTIMEGQPMRFATILFYLNEDMSAGETAFPRWMNANSQGQLMVKPETGKAILFYSLLPDGNMDDLSQHAAQPVRSGEKWLINLWFWDPEMKY